MSNRAIAAIAFLVWLAVVAALYAAAGCTVDAPC